MNVSSFQCPVIFTLNEFEEENQFLYATTYNINLCQYRRSNFMRCNNFSALYGISLVVAIFSATLNWAERWTLYESCNEYLYENNIENDCDHFHSRCLKACKIYPNTRGLNSFKMLGKVRCVRKVPWPFHAIKINFMKHSKSWNLIISLKMVQSGM